jgi:hypothetical protein
MATALSGIRVAAFTHFAAGPIAAQYLGSFGADVIKSLFWRGGSGMCVQRGHCATDTSVPCANSPGRRHGRPVRCRARVFRERADACYVRCYMDLEFKLGGFGTG